MARALLYQGQPGASSAAVFTASGTTTITSAVVCNPTAGAVTLEIWYVQSGDTAADDTLIYDVTLSVAAGATVGLDKLIQLSFATGSALHMKASGATSLTVTICGEVG